MFIDCSTSNTGLTYEFHEHPEDWPVTYCVEMWFVEIVRSAQGSDLGGVQRSSW